MVEKKIPKGWHKEDFMEISTNFDGMRDPLNKTQRKTIQGKYPYYGATGQVDSINDYKFEGRFLMITEDASLANPLERKKSIAYIAEGKFWVNNHAHVVQTNKKVDLDFLCHYINSLEIMDYAKKQQTRAKLRKRDLDKIPVIYPKPEEQRKIINKIDKIYKQLDQKYSKILELQKGKDYRITKGEEQKYEIYFHHLKATILKKAFSGSFLN
jgi:type I restriction enzyme, S subunit